MKVSDKWSECVASGIGVFPDGPPLGLIVDGQVLVYVNVFTDEARWEPVENWDGLSERS